jgi:hypothetical protein
MEPQQRQHVEIQSIVKSYSTILGQAYDAVIDEDVSKYPIIVIYQDMIEVGIPIIENIGNGSLWSINISTLEELSVKQLVPNEKVASFIEIYKNPEKQFCIFVVSQIGANFVFIPR